MFESYLKNRKHIVVVDNMKSTVQAIKAGVPQGSKLGPLLFLNYINYITKGLESDIVKFADDYSLLSTGNQEQADLMLNRDLIKISAWATKWNITFNAEKTKKIIFFKKIIMMLIQYYSITKSERE